MSALVFPDDDSLADLGRYATKAKAAEEGGVMRLHAVGTTLAAYVAVLSARDDGSGAVVGLRTMRLAEPGDADVVMPLASVTDRTARKGAAQRRFTVPPTTLDHPIAGFEPPREGWELLTTVPCRDLVAVVERDEREIIMNTPSIGGEQHVRMRRIVWGRPLEAVPDVVTGAAYGAQLLGFLDPDGEAAFYACGTWRRLSTRAGHVLVN